MIGRAVVRRAVVKRTVIDEVASIVNLLPGNNFGDCRSIKNINEHSLFIYFF